MWLAACLGQKHVTRLAVAWFWQEDVTLQAVTSCYAFWAGPKHGWERARGGLAPSPFTEGLGPLSAGQL